MEYLEEKQLERSGDTQPPKEAVCAKGMDGKKEDVYPNKKETFQEEVSQDVSVWNIIDQPPTLLGIIKELHLKWSRGHVPGAKEQESGAHNLGKEQSKMAPDHLDRNHHSPQEAVVRNDSMWPPACNLDQETKSNDRSGQDHKNDSKRGKDDFCWPSNISGSAAVTRKEPPLVWHQNKVSSSSSYSSSEEEHQSPNETTPPQISVF